MKDISLAVLAAGMGSRYGGIKQLDPVGPSGELIIDYSIFDAREAGFNKIVFIIKHAIEEDFKKTIGNRVGKKIKVEYAFQELSDIPEGVSLPEGRVKPWGTAHALLAAREIIDGPFAVINADDYYGKSAFVSIFNYLSAMPESDKLKGAMVAYKLGMTVTDNGSVSRGVCEIGKEGCLKNIRELTKIEKRNGGIEYTQDGGKTYTSISSDTPVSMNMWGFSAGFIPALGKGLRDFLDEELPYNPLKCEYLIPSKVGELIKSGEADIKVLESRDKWFGVTYKEDKPGVVKALAAKVESGEYKSPLWK